MVDGKQLRQQTSVQPFSMHPSRKTTSWKIRKAVNGLKESPRLWQEELDRVLEEMAWYSDY
eukprot:1790107-Prorocentrum_lima.AAC.1